jgi:uncharacterized damage-inducible protein DinB
MDESARVRPEPAEYDPYYGRYIERVEQSDVLQALSEQLEATLELLRGLDPARGEYRYAPGKWSVKQVLCHVLDSERIFAARALCIARGDTQPLPGFDENAYAEQAGADQRSIGDLAEEFDLVRNSTIALYRSLDAQAWQRIGNANGAAVSVRAIAWIVAGHAAHHERVLRERYLEAQ